MSRESQPGAGRGASEMISVVLPVYNEHECLAPLLDRLLPALEKCSSKEFEIIFVDDGSTDGSAEILDSFHARDPRIMALHLSRNFGHQAALQAGLDEARGMVWFSFGRFRFCCGILGRYNKVSRHSQPAWLGLYHCGYSLYRWHSNDLMILLGVIGEYLGRVYDEVRQRPLYIVRSRTGPETDRKKDEP